MTRIVVGVDGSPASAAALRWAVTEARALQASLELLHATGRSTSPVPDGGGSEGTAPRADDPFERFLRDAEVDLEHLAVTRTLRHDGASAALLDAARHAWLVVVGDRGTGGFRGLLLGSVAEHVARHATCPVAVVPSAATHAVARVVVGVDGSPGSLRAAAWAGAEAARRRARLEVVGVYRPYDAPGPFGGTFMQLASPASTARFRHVAEQAVDRALEVLGREDAARSVLEGHPAAVLVEQAGDDLLVVGRRGREGFAELRLGSVSRQVLHHARGVVVVVPG